MDNTSELKTIFDDSMLSGILPPNLLYLARRMNAVEPWVADAPALKNALDELGLLFLHEPHAAGVYIEENSLTMWARCLAHIHTSSALALMRILGQAQPGLGGDLLLRCAALDRPGDPYEAEARVTLARIAKIARYEIYTRVFGPERRRCVLEILDELTGGAS